MSALFREKRLLWFSAISGLGSGIAMELGRIWETGGSIRHFGMGSWLRILASGFLFAAFYGVLIFRLSHRREKEHAPSEFRKKRFLAAWLGIFLCWIPAFLAYYPTIWSYDVSAQVPALRGVPPTTWQPLLHTLYLESFLQIGGCPGDYEVGMVLLSLTQMLAMSAMFAYAAEKAYSSWGRKASWIGMLVFYGLFPVNAILSISMTKDVLFSGCWLIGSVKLYELCDDPEVFFRSPRKLFSLVLMICLALSLRANTVYAFAFGVFAGVLFLSKGERKKFLCLGLLCVCIYWGGQGVLFHVMHAEKGNQLEPFCLPMQCLVGTALRHPELIPERGTGQMLMGAVPRDLFSDNLEDNYLPYLTDPVKERWRRMDLKDFDSADLVRAWIDCGVRYPTDVLDLWGTLTLGLWYPLDETHAYIYDGEGERQGYLLTDFKNLEILEMGRPPSKWPWMEGLYEKIATENVHQENWMTAFFFAPAFYCWILFFCILLAWYQKRRSDIIVLGMTFFYWGTLMLGPAALVRYAYPVMVLVPVALSRFSLGKRLSSLPECDILVPRQPGGTQTLGV